MKDRPKVISPQLNITFVLQEITFQLLFLLLRVSKLQLNDLFYK